MTVIARLRDAARHQALREEAVERDRVAPGRRWTRELDGRRRAPDHGRRADLRRRSTTCEGAGVEHRRARADQARAMPSKLLRRLRDTLRARRAAALRPGQVVPGRAAAALGLRRSYWRSDGEPLWRDAGPDRHRGCRRTPAQLAERWSASSGARAAPGRVAPQAAAMAAYEDPAALPCWPSRSLPVSVDAGATTSWTIRAERQRLAWASSSKGSTASPATCCRSWRARPARSAGAGVAARGSFRRDRLYPAAGRLADGPAPAARHRLAERRWREDYPHRSLPTDPRWPSARQLPAAARARRPRRRRCGRPRPSEAACGNVRMALEARDAARRVHVFLPPQALRARTTWRSWTRSRHDRQGAAASGTHRGLHAAGRPAPRATSR